MRVGIPAAYLLYAFGVLLLCGVRTLGTPASHGQLAHLFDNGKRILAMHCANGLAQCAAELLDFLLE